MSAPSWVVKVSVTLRVAQAAKTRIYAVAERLDLRPGEALTYLVMRGVEFDQVLEEVRAAQRVAVAARRAWRGR